MHPKDLAAASGRNPERALNLEHYWMPFTDNRRFKAKPKLVVSAKDMYYTTAEGKQVLDGLATLWCVNAGHGRPRIVEAIRKQAGELDFAASFSLGHPLRVSPGGAHCRGGACRHGPCVLHQLGLGGGRHGAQDGDRLSPAARAGDAHALRRPRALLPRRQHRGHLGGRRGGEPQGLQRRFAPGRGPPAAYPWAFRKSFLQR